MARPSEEKTEVCPYCSGITTQQGHSYIRCLLNSNVNGISILFQKSAGRDEWYDEYCTSFCYQSCVFYSALETLDLEESDS